MGLITNAINNQAKPNPTLGSTYYQPQQKGSYEAKVDNTVAEVQKPVQVKTGNYVKPVSQVAPEYKTPANASDGNLSLKDRIDTGEATDAEKAQYEKNIGNIFKQGTQNKETAKTDEDVQRVANNRTEGDVEQAKADLTWRQKLADDKKEQRRKRTILAINAIGDTLRNLGNLYYTTKGAAPQAIANNTQTLWEQYENERQEKEAKEAASAKTAYQHEKDKQAQANKDRDYELSLVSFGLRKNADYRATEKEKRQMVLDAQRLQNLISQGKKNEAEALIAAVDAKYAEKLKAEELKGKKLTNQGHVLENSNKRLTAQEKKQNIAKGKTEKTTRYTVNGKTYDVPNDRVKDVNNRLLDYANQHMPARDDDKSWSAQDKIAWAKRQKNTEVDRIMKSSVDDKDPYKL